MCYVWKTRSSCPAGRASFNQHGMQMDANYAFINLKHFSIKIRQHTHTLAVAGWCAAQSSVDVQSRTFWITKWCLSLVFEEYYLWSLFSCISYFTSLWETVFSESTFISCCIFAIYTFLPRKITLSVSKQWSIDFKSKSCWYLRQKWLDPLLSKFQGQVIIKYDWLHFLMVFLCSLKCIQIFRITSDHDIQNPLWWLLTSRNVFSNL